jgi:hypothetical protein
MRTATICAALAAFLATGPARPQAVEPPTLTLACTGTMERGRGDIPVYTGIVVDFRSRTVFGPSALGPGAPPTITGLSDVKINFRATRKFENDWSMTIDGEIDRITGDARVVAQTGKSQEIPSLTETYSLKCRPSKDYGFKFEVWR